MKIALQLPVPGPNYEMSDTILVTEENNTIYVSSQISPQKTNEPIMPGYIEFEIEVDIESQPELKVKHAIVFTENPETPKFEQNKSTFTHYVRNTNSTFLDTNYILHKEEHLAVHIKSLHSSFPLTFTFSKSPTFSYQSPLKATDDIDAQIQNTLTQAQPKPQATNTAAEGSMLGTIVAGALTVGFFAFATIVKVLGSEPDHREKLDL